MSHAQVQAAFSSELHPRAPKGSSTGGQFSSGGSESKSSPPAKKTTPAPTPKRHGRRRTIPHGQLGFDGVSGTGYGMRGGDPRVRTLQAELNRLGMLDMHGRRLAVDGKLGPLTTSSIRAAQRRLGMRATGIIDPAFIARLKATRALPAAKKRTPRHKVPGHGHQSVRAAGGDHFDPMQARDDHGRWSKIGAALHAIAEAAKVAVVGHETFGGEEGHSHSHGIVAAHPGGDFTLALHDKDTGTHPVMTIPDDYAREELQNGFAEVWSAHDKNPNATGAFHAEDGSWRIDYDHAGATLHANLDDDEAMEHVRLSHADVETIEMALADIAGRAESADAPDYTAPLPPGERMLRNKKSFGDADSEFGVVGAAVDTPNGPRVRLGAIAQGDNGLKNWTGGRGQTTVDLDGADAAKVADTLGRFDAAQKARQKIFDRHIKDANAREDAGEDVDWDQVDAAIKAEIGPSLEGSNGISLEGTNGIASWEDDYAVERIKTPWGTVRLTDVGMDDEANAHERHTRIEIWPAGMTETEYDAGDKPNGGPDWAWPGTDGYQKPSADIQPKDMRGLARLLRATFAEPVTAAASEPYGDVEYADPGYQPDGKKRYPLDSKAHCRAAWSYINQADNAAKYTAEQLAKVKAKILAAGKRYGIEFADESKKVAAAEMRGIELARPGKWNLASGPMDVTDLHLIDAARYAQRKGARPGYMKIGHTDKRFSVGDGEPALGWVENVRREVDEQGPVLLGDLLDMPEWFAAAARKHWPYRSIEGWADYTDPDTGEKYALVVDGVAVLGVTPPGMTSLQSLRDLPQAVGAAAGSGTRVVASMASAPVAADPTNKEADRMSNVDPVKFREALGLPASASDDEVRSTLAATDYAADPPPDPAPVQASLFGEEKPVKNESAKKEMAGVIRVEASAWEAAQQRIKALEATEARRVIAERDEVIAQAVRDGKFAPVRKPHWVRLWDADPDGAREAIEGLAKNVIPVMASGYSGGVDDFEDSVYAELFGPAKGGVSRG